MDEADSFRSNINKICLHAFMTGLRPFLPIIFVFFMDLGFSYTQIGMLFSIQSLSVLFLEIPAGSFADRFGAKWSLVLSSFFLGTTLILIAHISSYTSMSLVFILWGAGKAFYSGSDTTLIIESLGQSGKKYLSSKFLGRKWACFYYGLAGGGLLCPLFLAYDIRSTFLFSGILTLVSIFILLTVKQPPLDKSENGEIHHIASFKEYFQYIVNGKNYLLRHRTIKYLLIFSVMFAVSSMVFFQYIQKMLTDSGIETKYFGYFYACFTVIAAFCSQKAYILDRMLGEKRTIYLLIFMTITALFTPSILVIFPLFLIPHLIMQMQAGLFMPLMNHYLNHHIESHHRATLNSIKSFCSGVMIAICSTIVGLIADHYDYRTGLFCLGGLFLLVAIGPSLKISERISRKRKKLVT